MLGWLSSSTANEHLKREGEKRQKPAENTAWDKTNILSQDWRNISGKFWKLECLGLGPIEFVVRSTRLTKKKTVDEKKK